jgi:hypothetical protein
MHDGLASHPLKSRKDLIEQSELDKVIPVVYRMELEGPWLGLRVGNGKLKTEWRGGWHINIIN